MAGLISNILVEVCKKPINELRGLQVGKGWESPVDIFKTAELMLCISNITSIKNDNEF